MRKILLIVLLLISIISLTSCDKQELELEISNLEQEKIEIEAEIELLNEEKAYLESNLQLFKEDNGIEQYIIVFEIKQSHFTLDITEHLKDEFNAIEIELPVSKVFYEEVSIGDVISDEFRTGSFWLKGSVGSWDITIFDKYVN